MIKKIGLKQLGLFSVMLIFVLSACQKASQTGGLDLQPGSDLLTAFQTDTLTINAQVEKEDSIRTDELSTSMLGSYHDPVFGITTASICTQVSLSTSAAVFPSVFEIDSVVLSLVYADKSFYGRLVPQYFNVHELDQDLYLDTLYYSDQIPRVTGFSLVEMGSESLEIYPREEVPVRGDTLVPQLRIPLELSLGQRLMVPSVSGALDNNDNFQAYFKGVYIQTQPLDAAILNFDLVDPDSKLTIYYRDLDGDEPDTTSYDFVITSDCARYTVFDHQYGASQLNGLTSSNSLSGDINTYIQGGAGTKTRLEFPGLMNFNDIENRTVNKAELIIPYESGGRFYPQDKMFLLYKNQDGDLAILPDQVSNSIGGTVNTSDREYRFNITRYVQRILNGDLTPESLYLLSSSAGISVARVQAHGPHFNLDDKTDNMRLVITLSH